MVFVMTAPAFSNGEEEMAEKAFNMTLGAGMSGVSYKALTGETLTLPTLKASPVFGIPPVKVGIDVNYVIADKTDKDKLGDTGKNPVVLSWVEYEREPLKARWGVLQNMTLGHGLVMNNYTSASTQESALWTNKDKGAYVTYKPEGEMWGGTLMGTYSGVWGLRGVYDVPSVREGFEIGATYVTDNDDHDDVSVTGLDLKFPLFAKVDLIAEYADVSSGGSGLLTGFDLGLGENLKWTTQYRDFDRDFIPSFFDAHYEIDSSCREANLAGCGTIVLPTTDQNGFFSKLYGKLGDPLGFSVSYEKYDKTEPRLIGVASIDLSKGGEATGYGAIKGSLMAEQKNFRLTSASDKNTVITGTASMPVSEYLSLLVTYKRLYQPDTTGTLRPVTSLDYGFMIELPQFGF